MKTHVSAAEYFVNGSVTRLVAATLADIVRAQGLGEVKVATALNGQFIPAAARATTRVNEGDKIEIVSARQGG